MRKAESNQKYFCRFANMISKNRIKYVRSLSLKKNRDMNGVFVAEGPKIVSDLMSYFRPVYIAATNDWINQNYKYIENQCCEFPDEFSFDEVLGDELARISFLETPQKVLCVFRQPYEGKHIRESVKDNICLALDSVQNPGNLGTIIRVADWFGIHDVYCNITCADVYNPKTVQATMGALSRVRVYYVDLEDELSKLPSDSKVYGTFLDGDNMYDHDLSSNGVIVMGNEGRGISESVGDFVTNRIFIPNYPSDSSTSESLNVAIATSIVCAEFRRRLL